MRISPAAGQLLATAGAVLCDCLLWWEAALGWLTYGQALTLTYCLFSAWFGLWSSFRQRGA